MAPNKDKIRAAAQKHLQKGNIDKAIKEFERLVELDPKDVRTLLKVGDLQTRLEQHDEAMATYMQVAAFYSEQGFFLKAVAVYKQILKISPDDIDVNVKLADLYNELGLNSDATNQYQQLAQIFEANGELDKAVEILEKLLASDEENIACRIKLAEVMASLEKLGASKSHFERAAKILKDEHRVDDYVKVAERLLHHFPDDLILTKELANIYIQMGNARRALAKLQICFKANPKDIPTLDLLANAFRELGQLPKAVSVYKEMAQVHHQHDDNNAYRKVMQRVLELSPDDPDAKRALSEVPQAQSGAETLGRIRPAQKPVAGGLVREVDAQGNESSQPASPVAPKPTALAEDGEQAVTRMLTEADVYAKYGLKKKAADHIRRIFDINPDHEESLLKFNELHGELGTPEVAAPLLHKAAQRAKDDGNKEKALMLVDLILQSDPSHEEATSLKRTLGGAQEYTASDELVLEDEADLLTQDPDEIVLADDFDALEQAQDELEPELEEEFPVEPGASDEDAGLTIQAGAKSAADELMPAKSGESEIEGLQDLDDAGLELEELAPTDFESTSELEIEIEGLEAQSPPQRQSNADTAPDPEPELEELEPELALEEPSLDSEPSELPKSDSELAFDDGLELELDDPAETTGQQKVSKEEPQKKEKSSALGAELEELLSSAVPKRKSAPTSVADGDKATPDPIAHDVDEGDDEDLDGEVDLSDEIEEIGFFLEQGLDDDAHEMLNALLQFHPDHPQLLEYKQKLDSAQEEAEPALESEATPAMGDDFDLAAELADDMQEAADDYQVAFTDVFDDFKRGVAETVDESDHDTHYNLGIAYREMGLFEDAIHEFELAQHGSEMYLGSLTMIGECHRHLKRYDDALETYLMCLQTEGLQAKETIALRFEIGHTYEMMGQPDDALSFYEKVRAEDPGFRDVEDRIEAVKQGAGKRGANISYV